MSNYYVITKTINNNIAFSKNEQGREIVVFGKAIAFGVKRGALIDKKRVEKVFVLENEKERTYFETLLADIGAEYIELASQIVHQFETVFKHELTPTLVMSLADHLYNAVDNAKRNITTPNGMLNEIMRLYPREFSLARGCLDLINYHLHVQLGDEEAGFIVLHYINAASFHMSDDISKRVNVVNKIVMIVDQYFNVSLDKDSYKYQRFITHLSFFATRLFDESKEKSMDDFVYRIIKIQYPDIVKCVELIETFIEEDFNKKISNEEKGYLVIHIHGLLKHIKERK